MKRSLALLPLALSAALLSAGLRADETTNSIKFSHPDQPGTLRVTIARGDIRIIGADTPEVVVTTEMAPKHQTRSDGLRVLTEAATYALTEKDNTVTLDATSDGWSGASSDFKIKVPRNTNIVVQNAMGGDIVCGGVQGDMEVKSLHGEVQLDDISSSAVVDTMNGEITANVRELKPGKTLSFTSMNGEVLVKVPADGKANVRLRTQNGSILTDFDEKTLVTKLENVGGGPHGRALSPDLQRALREAGRAGAIAAQHAAEAIREAAEAAREGANEASADGENGDPKIGPIPPIPPLPPTLISIPTVTGGKLVTGTLNGGGPEINVTTMNGDVTLRKK